MTDALSPTEADYLSSQQLGRISTVSSTAQPHVVPVLYRFNDVSQTIELGLHSMPPPRGQSRLYRSHLEANPIFAFVVDDVISREPWTPRGLELRGRATVHLEGGERFGSTAGPVWIELIPRWISSWGIDTPPFQPGNSRAVAHVSADEG